VAAHVFRFFGHKNMATGNWSLDDDDVVHALKVLRLSDDALIEVMDGAGHMCAARLKIQSKSKASAAVIAESFTPKDLISRTIILGALKPGDVDELIAPLVELGIDRIIVFRQEDTPHFRLSDNASDRWERLVKTAMKQSKRPWMVVVEAADTLNAALERVADHSHKWILSPEAPADILTVATSVTSSSGVVALLGGERGLSSREEDIALAAGFAPVKIGPWVLRAKTAASAAAVFLGMLPRSR
jgi:16S rRNA (uracil1498-N3)-methyltransferase